MTQKFVQDCKLSSERLYPSGNGAPVMADKAVFYEKLCLTHALATHCNGHLQKHVQVLILIIKIKKNILKKYL